MVKREQPLGSLEHIVLLAVMRLGENAYGISVRREIEATTGRELSIGAVHPTLVRLESKGFVTSFAGEPTAVRGGRTKRYFRMTAEGKAILRATHEMLQKMGAGLEELPAS
jgi:DNA-binding PadR family transcriptional regulator